MPRLSARSACRWGQFLAYFAAMLGGEGVKSAGVIKKPTAVGVLPVLIVSIVLFGSLLGSSQVPFRAVLASSCGYGEGRPDVSGVSPNSGPVAGGTTVTITGSGFCNLLSVNFGAVAATSFTVISNTLMTAVSPAEPAGTVDVRVTTVGGTSPIIDGDRFTYGPLPPPSPEPSPPTPSPEVTPPTT